MTLRTQIHDHIPTWLDAINRNVGIVQLLEHLDTCQDFDESSDGSVLIGRCPFHGGDDATEFYVYSKRNTWACYGQCHRSGTPLDFVSIKFDVSYPVAALLIQNWFSLDLVKLQLIHGEEE